MTPRGRIGVVFALVSLLVSTALAAAGRIDGRVVRGDGNGVGGVSVVLNETKTATLTDSRGNYSLSGVPGATYTIIYTLGSNSFTQTGVEVKDGQTSVVNVTVDWEIGLAETVTVYSASRRVERVVDAPAAVTVIDEAQIEREASHGQVPKLLEFTPGAEVTQSGVYDYNFNTRGFNSSLNRRVATLIDGRDPSVPFLGAQEWAGISFPLDDLASIELVRGPSAALYGANASSGVLNLSSKQPRYSPGGMVRISGGELNTLNTDFRWAGGLGGDWFLKVLAGTRDHGDYTVSRTSEVEYSVPCSVPGETDCLPLEAAPLVNEDDDKIRFGSVRADRYFDHGGVFTVEAGHTTIEGPAFQTGIGRVQLVDIERPWARVNYTMEHLNVLASYTGRKADEQLSLSTGGNLALDTDRVTIQAQTNWNFAGDRLRLVGGVSHAEEDIDSRGCPVQVSPCPVAERQTLLFEALSEDKQAAYAQLDFDASDKVKLVAAARVDRSSLHDTEFSPKASIVFSIADDHKLRLTYNEAFQVANYSEFFLQAQVGAPVGLASLEGLCQANGVTDCGLASPVPVLALGNEDLDTEQVKSVELGYSAIFANRAFFTLDYYRGQQDDFITDLVPQFDTSDPFNPLPVNPNFGVWVGSTAAETTINMVPIPGLPAGSTVADAVRYSLAASGLLPAGVFLSNNLNGAAILAARSYTNFGSVDTQGVDLGLNYYLDSRWQINFAYSWFDFALKQSSVPFADQLLPNSPENKSSVGVVYAAEKLEVGVSGRWVDDFRWVVGPFQGDVESYTTVDMNLNYRFDEQWSLGVNVSNLLDNDHYESFGGDIIERRALGNVTFRWR